MDCEPGIDYWVATGKYRVRITRNKVSYKVGLFENYEDAVKAKQDFLKDFELNSDKIEAETIPMYSKEWFKRERVKQIASFKSNYSTPTKQKPVLIVTSTSWGNRQTHEALRYRTAIENDLDILFET